MALIMCPECGKEVSDKVKNCPHCGYPFSEKEHQEIEQDVVASTEEPTKKKKSIIYLAVIVVVIVGIVAGIFVMKMSAEKQERAEYISNLSLVRITMLSGAAEAESLCNLTKSVWYNTIYKESDSKTDKFTKTKSGYSFNSDFNTSLSLLYSDDETKTTVEKIKENQETVSGLMKDLQNPPEDLSACYTTVDSMYEAYQNLTGLAISPSGSLTTFSEDFREADSDFMKYYQKLEMQIPDQ